MRKLVSTELLTDLCHRAQESPRKRCNQNFHDDLADPINRMLNAFEPGSFVQAHKHLDKREVFIVLKGSLVIVFFDDSGHPEEFVLLDPEKGNLAVEIPVGNWHTIFAIQPGSVVYEIKDGPYVQITDKIFADWAPREGDADCENYLEKLTDQYYNR